MARKWTSLAAAAAQQGIAEYGRQFAKRGRNLRPIWEAVIGEFHKGEKQVLEAEGRVGGWHPRYVELTEGYRKWKNRHFPGRRRLDLTGTMHQHLTMNPAPDCYYVKDHTRLTIIPGMKLPNHPGDLIAVHQMGRKAGSGESRANVTVGSDDWSEGTTYVSNAGGGGIRTAMAAREPVRLTKREVRNITRLATNYVVYGRRPRGGGAP